MIIQYLFILPRLKSMSLKSAVVDTDNLSSFPKDFLHLLVVPLFSQSLSWEKPGLTVEFSCFLTPATSLTVNLTRVSKIKRTLLQWSRAQTLNRLAGFEHGFFFSHTWLCGFGQVMLLVSLLENEGNNNRDLVKVVTALNDTW